MSRAILATVLGRSVTLFASCGKLAAPSLTSAPKPSGQALVPMVRMLSTRPDCHRLHYLRRFPCSPAKLDNLCRLVLRSALQGFPENRRFVKLNHFRHSSLHHACQSLMDGLQQADAIHTQDQGTQFAQPESEQNCSTDRAFSSAHLIALPSAVPTVCS
jgi:hypothetical protein